MINGISFVRSRCCCCAGRVTGAGELKWRGWRVDVVESSVAWDEVELLREWEYGVRLKVWKVWGAGVWRSSPRSMVLVAIADEAGWRILAVGEVVVGLKFSILFWRCDL